MPSAPSAASRARPRTSESERAAAWAGLGTHDVLLRVGNSVLSAMRFALYRPNAPFARRSSPAIPIPDAGPLQLPEGLTISNALPGGRRRVLPQTSRSQHFVAIPVAMFYVCSVRAEGARHGGGGLHAERCRLTWELTSGPAARLAGSEAPDKGRRGRLNEALLVACGAAGTMTLGAVDRVVKLGRDLDRYRGFVAAGRRLPESGRRESRYDSVTAFGAAFVRRPEISPQGLEEIGFAPGISSASVAAGGFPKDSAEPALSDSQPERRPEILPQRLEDIDSAPELAKSDGVVARRATTRPIFPLRPEQRTKSRDQDEGRLGLAHSSLLAPASVRKIRMSPTSDRVSLFVAGSMRRKRLGAAFP